MASKRLATLLVLLPLACGEPHEQPVLVEYAGNAAAQVYVK